MSTRTLIRDWVRSQSMTETDDLADTKLDAILNDGIYNIATLFDWPYLATSATIAFVADQQAYTLPADMQKISKVVVTDGKVLNEVSPNRIWDTYGDSFPSQTTPTMFFLWGDTINFVATPSVSSGSATIYYFKEPTILTDDAHEPEFAEQFHMILAEYMLQKVWEREEDFAKADVHAKAFLGGVERMARFYLNRSSDHPMVFGDGQKIRTSLYPNMPWMP